MAWEDGLRDGRSIDLDLQVLLTGSLRDDDADDRVTADPPARQPGSDADTLRAASPDTAPPGAAPEADSASA